VMCGANGPLNAAGVQFTRGEDPCDDSGEE
jgi:hypothetical protein